MRTRSCRLVGLAFYAALVGAFVIAGFHSGRNTQQADQAAVTKPVRCVDATEYARETGSADDGQVTSRIVRCHPGYAGPTYYVDATIGGSVGVKKVLCSRNICWKITSRP